MSTLPPPGWTADIPDADWDAAVDRLRTAIDEGGRVVLLCHADPDGDALGSMLALHLFLRRQGLATVASWGSEPFQVPPQYTFLPGLASLTPPDEVPRRPDLLVTLDSGSRERLGSLAELVDRAGDVVVIDHHQSNTRFGTVDLVAPRAAATAVIVEELIRRLGGSVDRELASCLYVGLVTDTGRFQYANTDQAALELGGRLLEKGIEHDRMSRQMFDTHSFGYLKVMARMLERATFVPELSLVYSWIELADLERFGVAIEETEGAVDFLRTVDTADVSLIAKEVDPGLWRVSLRSRSGTDVGALAESLGGGGHWHMAGFTGEGAIEDVVAEVSEALADESVPTPEAG